MRMINAQAHFLISFDIDITQLVPLLFRGPTQFLRKTRACRM